MFIILNLNLIIEVMKRYLLKITMVVVALVYYVGVYTSQRTHSMSDIMIANVEALARGESGQKLDCWQHISSTGNVLATHVTYCGSCDAILAKSWSSQSMCVN